MGGSYQWKTDKWHVMNKQAKLGLEKYDLRFIVQLIKLEEIILIVSLKIVVFHPFFQCPKSHLNEEHHKASKKLILL